MEEKNNIIERIIERIKESINNRKNLVTHDFGKFTATYSEEEFEKYKEGTKFYSSKFYHYLKKRRRIKGNDKDFMKQMSFVLGNNTVLNTGWPISMDEIKDKNDAAKVFSEGNEDLERLLNYVWDNGLNTNACCGGHEDDRASSSFFYPYISFNIGDDFDTIIKVADKLIEMGYDITYKEVDNSIRIVFYDFKYKVGEKTNLFNDILNTIKEIKNTDYFIHNSAAKLIALINSRLEETKSELKLEKNLEFCIEPTEEEYYCQLSFREMEIKKYPNLQRIIKENNLSEKNIIFKIKSNNLQEFEEKIEIIIKGIYTDLTQNKRNELYQENINEEKEYIYKPLSNNEVCNLISYGIVSSLEEKSSQNIWYETNKSETWKNFKYICELPKNKFSKNNNITINDLSGIYIVEDMNYNLIDYFKELHTRCKSRNEVFVSSEDLHNELKKKIQKDSPKIIPTSNYNQDNTIDYIEEDINTHHR